jgi:redox-sensitive bicupin YhaK (pirin superfamily)
MGGKIKKKIRFSLNVQCAQLGGIEVQHVLPNEFAQAIGPFVFVEHFLSYKQSLNGLHKGFVDKRSNPLRGIATLTYILAGEVEHLDSMGNHVKLNSGGVHWTNAGKGIVHNETVRSLLSATNPDISVVRFWVNLHSTRKSGQSEYIALQPSEIPKKELHDIAGWIKILLGEYEQVIAKFPCHSKEFLYHIYLEAAKQFRITTKKAIEYAIFLPSDKAFINDIEYQSGSLIVFSSHGEIIEMINKSESAIDILIFGGELYNESVVAEGTFVMNTPHEITQAYNDFYDGKYGQIKDL